MGRVRVRVRFPRGAIASRSRCAGVGSARHGGWPGSSDPFLGVVRLPLVGLQLVVVLLVLWKLVRLLVRLLLLRILLNLLILVVRHVEVCPPDGLHIVLLLLLLRLRHRIVPVLCGVLVLLRRRACNQAGVTHCRKHAGVLPRGECDLRRGYLALPLHRWHLHRHRLGRAGSPVPRQHRR